jgi:hypothetical protein
MKVPMNEPKSGVSLTTQGTAKPGSDIVQRLRVPSPWNDFCTPACPTGEHEHPRSIFDQAADEIERLESVIEAARVQVAACQTMIDEHLVWGDAEAALGLVVRGLTPILGPTSLISGSVRQEQNQ